MQQLNVYQLVSSRLPVYIMSINCIAHYQVAFRLCVETSLRAQPFMKMCFFRFYNFLLFIFRTVISEGVLKFPAKTR